MSCWIQSLSHSLFHLGKSSFVLFSDISYFVVLMNSLTIIVVFKLFEEMADTLAHYHMHTNADLAQR
jgi:hypothetical protein